MSALTQILDHAAKAVARLAAQFTETTRLKGMISAIGDEIQAAENGLWGILLTRDIDNASDATLDLIGKLVGAPQRGAKNDVQYRDRVKAQIIINKSTGRAADIYQVASRVIEAWAPAGSCKAIEDYASCGYTIGAYPVGSITNNKVDAQELGRILEDMNSAGVRGIVLSQSQNAGLSFSFQHGPGLGFGQGAFVGAYDGGVKS